MALGLASVAKGLMGVGKVAARGAVGAGRVAGRGAMMASRIRGRKQRPQQQQPPSDGGGVDTGGAIVPAASSAIVPMGVKSSALAISQTPAGGGGGQDLEGTVLRIKTSVIKVENLLAGSAALQEKQREDQRKAREAAAAAASARTHTHTPQHLGSRGPFEAGVVNIWKRAMSCPESGTELGDARTSEPIHNAGNINRGPPPFRTSTMRS